MEQGDVYASNGEQHQFNVDVESVTMESLQRSISCQTEIVTDGAYEDLGFFFGNLNCHDGLSSA
ncbi:hypothetical protein HHI36_001555, partial [Cryptolaemus montrouzieri]